MNREKKINEEMLARAASYLGLKEIVGKDNNPVILDMFAEIGHSWVKDDETSWCSCFINFIAKRCGANISGELDARSWLNVGIATLYPEIGNVVVFWREKKESWKGHVGLFMGYTVNGDIYCLGGNQNNEVNISVYPKLKLLGFRILTFAH
jgi:uncharacterized protein (TIGR02594 family)